MNGLRPALALCALLAVTACSSSSEEEPDDLTATLAPDPCVVNDTATEVPAECVEEAPATPTGAPPSAGSAAYKPIVLPANPGRLAAGGNNTTVSKTTQTFTVSVKKGQRLGSHVACEGRTTMVVETEPKSGAEVEISCGFEGFPAEVEVLDPELLTADQTYEVTVTAPAPARWFAELYATSTPAPVDNGDFNPS